MRHSLLLVLVLAAPVLAASARPMSKGFLHFYNLEYDQALAEFRREAAENPNNPDPQNHIAQTILFREMYHVGALESEMVTGNNPFLRRPKMTPSEENKRAFETAIGRALELANARLEKNPKDIDALYAAGASWGLRSNYDYLVRKAWMDALHEATNSRKLNAKATEIDPNFVDGLMVQGLHDYLIGCLPWHYRVLGFLAGMRGDREGGLKRLERVAKEGDRNRIDAQILLCAIYRRERRPKIALPIIQQLAAQFPRNFLLRLELVQFHADAGDKQTALTILDKLEKDKRAGASDLVRLPLEQIFFYRGNLLFWYDDRDGALTNLKRAVAGAEELDANSAAYSWLRMAETLDLEGRRKEAVDAYRQVIALYPNSDPAHDAHQYLSSPYHRKG